MRPGRAELHAPAAVTATAAGRCSSPARTGSRSTSASRSTSTGAARRGARRSSRASTRSRRWLDSWIAAYARPRRRARRAPAPRQIADLLEAGVAPPDGSICAHRDSASVRLRPVSALGTRRGTGLPGGRSSRRRRRCCSSTATPSPPTCGITRCRRSPTPAGARSRPTCPGTATPSPRGRGPARGRLTSRRSSASSMSCGSGPVALVTHDWGVMIGLRWACDHPGAASALVISDGGFFSDRRWHDLANVMRTPGEGEQLIAATRARASTRRCGAVSSGIERAGARRSTGRRSPTTRAVSRSSSCTAPAISTSSSPTRAASRRWRCRR